MRVTKMLQEYALTMEISTTLRVMFLAPFAAKKTVHTSSVEQAANIC